MSRLFQTLVVAGAAISAAACAGKSTRETADEADEGGGGTTTSGGAGHIATGGSDASGGTPGTGGTGGDPGRGGTASSTGGSTAGGVTGTGGTGVGGLPEPGRGAHWDCSTVASTRECVAVNGTTATPIPEACPVDPTRPRTPADCAASEIFTCVLAVTPASELLLVNCYCEAGAEGCGICTNLQLLHGAPAYCDGVRKVCACAYTGILR